MGYEYCESIETVQVTFYRRILGVGSCTPKQAIIREIGKYLVALHYYSRCIKYWFKFICMPDQRYPKVCYSMVKVLDERCRITWASNIRCLLGRYGFSYLWIIEGVGDVDVIMGILQNIGMNHVCSKPNIFVHILKYMYSATADLSSIIFADIDFTKLCAIISTSAGAGASQLE